MIARPMSMLARRAVGRCMSRATTATAAASASATSAAVGARRVFVARSHSTATPATPASDAAQDCYLTLPSASGTPADSADSAGIAVLTLNRAAAKNALSRSLLSQLRASIDTLRTLPPGAARVVIVRSTVDKVFCAGADLKERKSMTPAQVSAFVTQLRETFSMLANLPMPTIAAIDGAALGGGLELAMCCDLRTAGPGAKVGLPETKLAIIPGAGGSQRLPRLVGVPIAKELMFTGRVLNAQEAQAIGLVNRVGTESAFDAAMALAREITPQGPVALRMAKWAIDKGTEVDLASGLKVEEMCYAQVIPTKDRLEGLKAFAEKRKPEYKGE
ncbi:ClpP/crotonase-like domain-containing protein [Catenaria anguillulae PL171]|uniref:ClpP/crotonase-like domain-containing protein n=1 Tax=Catenaria anguillulae PL171 TaxID=765915 RepID=A0A1Y2HH47_9FUNG|nr:ClpP/crotonase-like domain-containing protein [Catenaria anguillulae PL171]